MKRILIFLLLAASLTACKKKCIDCNQNQFCNNGTCQCKQWYEGSNCVPMAIKFSGTFIGISYLNAANPRADTFVFAFDSAVAYAVDRPFYLYQNGNYHFLNRPTILRLQSSTQAFCQIEGGGSGGDDPVNCGAANISQDGKNITLSYSPLTFTTLNTLVNPDTVYTFLGVKQ